MSAAANTPTAAEAELFTKILLDEANQVYNELNLTPRQLADELKDEKIINGKLKQALENQDVETAKLISQRNEMLEALGWYVEGNPKWKISYSGNPNAVQELVDEAHRRYSAANSTGVL